MIREIKRKRKTKRVKIEINQKFSKEIITTTNNIQRQ
jgi:hypothetical protein